MNGEDWEHKCGLPRMRHADFSSDDMPVAPYERVRGCVLAVQCALTGTGSALRGQTDMDAMAVATSKLRAVPRPGGAGTCLLAATGVAAADALETVKGERYHAVVYSSFDPISQSGVMAVLCGTLDLSVPRDECETGRIVCKAPRLARHSWALRGIADQVGLTRSGPVSHAGGISEVIGHAEH